MCGEITQLLHITNDKYKNYQNTRKNLFIYCFSVLCKEFSVFEDFCTV